MPMTDVHRPMTSPPWRLYADTLRYIDPSQLYHRLTERAWRLTVLAIGPASHRRLRAAAEATSLHPPAPDSPVFRAFLDIAWWRMLMPPRSWHEDRPREFLFLGQPLRLGFPPQWHGATVRRNAKDPALWQFNLHYFDWIWDMIQAGAGREAVACMLDWIRRNPLGARGCFAGPWSPYTTSLRIRNWIIALCWLEHQQLIKPTEQSTILRSLREQVVYLSMHLEKEHGANHLIENLMALAMASAYFDGPDSSGLFGEAHALLAQELAKQILPDGCHFERSPSYHAAIMDRLADLLVLSPPTATAQRKQLTDVLARMVGFLDHLMMPDGYYPLLGDSSRGLHPSPLALRARVYTLIHRPMPDPPDGLTVRDGHYVHRSSDSGDFLLFDAAPMGADSSGAHMHADLLGFELAFGGRHVVADGGAGIYRDGPARQRLRGPAEHAGLVVDGVACAEPWRSFRMGRRGHPSDIRHGSLPKDGWWIEASHDGFAPARATHLRRIEIHPRARRVRITETVTRIPGAHSGSFRVILRIPLHPDLTPKQVDATSIALIDRRTKSRIALLTWETPLHLLRVSASNGMHHPEFGRPQRRRVLLAVLKLPSGAPFTYALSAAC